MAAKKKPTTKPSAKPTTSKAPAKKVAPSVAVQLLAKLPPIDERHRQAFLRAFTEQQCEAWGSQTKAVNVAEEARKWLPGLFRDLGGKRVMGYSLGRFAWLCQLVADLEDAIAAQSAGPADGATARLERSSAVLLANRARRELVAGLTSVAAGSSQMRKLVAAANDSSPTPHVLVASLVALMQLATRWRRNEELELVCDESGVTAEFLAGVSSTMEALTRANERTYDAPAQNDSAETNRIEGRVLREMQLARLAFSHAKENGLNVSVPVPGKALSTILRSSADASDERPTPPASSPSGIAAAPAPEPMPR